MRQEEINSILKEDIENRTKAVQTFISKKYKENAEQYKNDFKKSLEEVLYRTVKKQKEVINGQVVKGKIKYIYVNCLRTTMETEDYEYIIRVMDEKENGDFSAVEGYYVPKYIEGKIKEDKEYFTKLIMSKIIRAKKYEVKDFLREYIWKTYLKPMPKEVEEVLKKIEDIEVYKEVNKTEETICGYGEVFEYLDQYWKFTV